MSDVLRGYHDVGGRPAGPVERTVHPFLPWQKVSEAMRVALDTKSQLVTLDELRRCFESFGEDLYNTLGFYERRAEALTVLLDEKGLISRADIQDRMLAMAMAQGISVNFATRSIERLE